MSNQGHPTAPLPAGPVDGTGRLDISVIASRGEHRYWLHLLLLVVTLLTTTAVGASISHNFENNLPAFTGQPLTVFGQFRHISFDLLNGLPFSLTLLFILLAHEMGHYTACKRYDINATLPFFLPLPLAFGTLGAFIRIRSPIYTKKALFDVGIAGPLAGFVILLPALVIGLALSKVIPGIAGSGELIFGVPLLERLLASVVFPGVDTIDIHLHPVARAAWIGMLATALNLLPIGQLDGGHILYSLVGHKHRLLSRTFAIALIPMGLLYSKNWLVWAAVIFILGIKHPSIQDPSRLGKGRTMLGILALVIFILSFTAWPVKVGAGV